MPHSDQDWRQLSVEPTGNNDLEPCACCGNISRAVWGFVRFHATPLATYRVQWTLNTPSHGAFFDLIVGQWGEGSSNRDRQAVSMVYRLVDNQAGFVVVDADTRPIADSPLASAALSRKQVLSSPLASRAFAIIEAIFMKDARILEVNSWE